MLSKKHAKLNKKKTCLYLPIDIIEYITQFMTLNDIVLSFSISHYFYDFIVKHKIEKIEKIDIKIENVYTNCIENCTLLQPCQQTPYFKIRMKKLEKLYNINTCRVDLTNIRVYQNCYQFWYDTLNIVSNLKKLNNLYIYTEDSYIIDENDVQYLENALNLEHLELTNITVTCGAVDFGLFELAHSMSIIDVTFEDIDEYFSSLYFQKNKKINILFLQGLSITEKIIENFLENFNNLKSLTLSVTSASSGFIKKKKLEHSNIFLTVL